MNVFIILQLFRSVPTLPKIVLGREQTEENNIARNANISDILTLLSLLSADAKLAVLLRVSLNKAEARNFPLLHFPFGSWATCYVSATYEKAGRM